MKKRKVLTSVMAVAMILNVSGQFVFAKSNDYMNNPSFENTIKKNEVQLYKAERTKEKAYDGNYSIKVGMEKPENEKEVPIWSYNYGKGSVNVVINNVKPNTTYEITSHFFNETGVSMSTGVLDIDGNYSKDYPWKLASDIKTMYEKSTEWETNVHRITTGPRTNQIYAFAYMEWTGNEEGAGVFYFDDVQVKEIKTDNKDITTIGYETKTDGFPNTIPAIQNFEQKEGVFKLTKRNQIFSTDTFSKEKAEYLAESMKNKGIIDQYSIQLIDNIEKAEGITLFKQPIQFELPNKIKNNECKKDAYQININQDHLLIYSDTINGIQNGSMTILQAFAQKDSLNCGTVQDYTDQNIRGLQVDSGRRYYSIEWLKNQIEQMAYYKQNVLQLRLKDNEGIRFDSKVAPELVDRKGGYWTKSEINELVNHADKFNIEIIPEVDFPGHSEQEANYHEEWKITPDSSALDFTKPEVREYMFAIYKEAVDLFHADTIHIGGDEFFQSRYPGEEADIILSQWAQNESKNENANEHDALKLFFNQAAKPFLDKGIKVLVWNDNIFSFDGAVDLDKRIIIDVWAGGIYGSISASEAVKSGYNVMSSSSSNYHDLWPKEDWNLLDRPAPKNLYENFTRYTYSGASFGYPFYNIDERLDKMVPDHLDQVHGQVFPIWDDAHGYVPEYILSRTLFPRYAAFAKVTWGASYEDNLNYSEFERLAYAIESPTPNLLGKQVSKNYTKADYKNVVQTIKDGLATIKTDNIEVQKNIDELNQLLNKENDKMLYTVEDVESLIRKYENVEFISEKGKVTVQYIDEDNKELCDPIIIENEIGKEYKTEVKEFEGYTLKSEPENSKGIIVKEEQKVVYTYSKNTAQENPNQSDEETNNPSVTDKDENTENKNDPTVTDKNENKNDSNTTDKDNNTSSSNQSSQVNKNVKTGDDTMIASTVAVTIISLIGALYILKTRKKQ